MLDNHATGVQCLAGTENFLFCCIYIFTIMSTEETLISKNIFKIFSERNKRNMRGVVSWIKTSCSSEKA
jgi:hypothetical protein